ncbi:flavin-containing monooxygenase [Nocardia iowensis]|uniref:NAD(P)/FAD-dependent oxidoreductase n=1 Tax=Nocardia iowensis TaxID=204891 RepID=A0ABX8RNN3_NOCIO|nr:NAD(P)/FAD-dependent oxidoreductase [Nocardia iowensis]QXN91244.1 NAD(P)/FAD-dependent oxidoreductase [Nocardia iowensis]
MTSAIHTRILIVGSGFSGLGMGIALDEAGIDDYLIVEKAEEIGGTWRDNTYPGCACDVPSHLYSYSFEPRTDWRQLFSGQQEIFEYLREVADKYRLRPHIRFRQHMAHGYWDEAERRWHAFSADGQEYVAQFLVSAVGALHIPSIPQFPGSADFTGPTFHSAQWDHAVELAGKRVAVIGTGASAIQFVPEIVGQVAELTVYQRTPPWVLPRGDTEFSDGFRRALRRIPGLRFALRNGIYWGLEVGGYAMNWRPGLLKVIERLGRRHIERQIADPVLRAKVTPDYRAGCKRLLGSDTYYPALADPKTELVTDRIDRITADGIVTADGVERPADVIIYGTGFHVIESYKNLPIVGLGGVDLTERWDREGVQAHLGITVADMPNAFFLVGPNTGLGHNSMIFMIEAQIHYVLQAIRQVRAQGAVALAPRRAAQDRFNARLQRGLSRSVWNTGGCRSWYLDEHGNNRTLWSGFTWQYWLRTRRLDPAEYEFFGPAPSSPTKPMTVLEGLPAQTFPTAGSNGRSAPANP